MCVAVTFINSHITYVENRKPNNNSLKIRKEKKNRKLFCEPGGQKQTGKDEKTQQKASHEGPVLREHLKTNFRKPEHLPIVSVLFAFFPFLSSIRWCTFIAEINEKPSMTVKMTQELPNLSVLPHIYTKIRACMFEISTLCTHIKTNNPFISSKIIRI